MLKLSCCFPQPR